MKTFAYTCTLAGVVAICSLNLGSSSALAADPPDPKLFDRNGDGLLDQGELDIYALHSQEKAFRDWDKNFDGVIDPKTEVLPEIKKLNASKTKTIERARKIAAENADVFLVDLTQPITGEEADEVLQIDRPRPKTEPGWFRLRGKVSDFPVPPKGGELESLPPAIFSWNRDFVADGDTWTARGAVGGFWEDEWSDLSVGAEFDRIATDIEGKDDTDTLIFRVMGSREVTLGSDKKVLSTLALRYGADYGTNFDFEGYTFGGALEIEPVWKDKAFTGIKSFFGKGRGWSTLNAPSITVRNYLRIEGGTSDNDIPNTPGLDDEYLRIGPQVDLSFWPFGTNRPISITAGYGYWAEVLGDGDDYHNFRTGLEWRLDPAGHFSLRLEYVNGVTPMLLQEQESLLLSLSARF